MFKKLITTVATLLLALSLCACGVTIDVEESRGEGEWGFTLVMTMETSLVSAIEKDAATIEGKSWTLQQWFERYFDVVGEIHGFEPEHMKPSVTADGRQFGAYFYISADGASQKLVDALDTHEDYDIHTNLFLRKIRVVRDGRFDWWVREFDAQYKNGAPVENDGAAVMALFLYGSTVQVGNEERTELPGFAEAFPSSAPYLARYGEARLHNYWYSSSKLIVNADQKLPTYNENGQRDRKVSCYYFEQEAADGDRAVEYSYYRVDPTGWYIVAVLGGLLAVGIVWLVVRARRKRATPPPRVEDEFPYDPFAEHQAPPPPDDNNPFSGY